MGYQFETSRPAYEDAKLSIAECQDKVLQAIKTLCRKLPDKRCNDRDIAAELRWDINRITPRRGELVTMGKVIEVGKFFNEETKRTVTYWKPAAQHRTVTLMDYFKL